MNLEHVLLPALIRAIDLLGMILLVGGLGFKAFVSPAPSRWEALAPIAAYFLLITGFGDLAARTHMISGRSFSEVWTFLPTVILKTHFGRVWLLKTALLFLLCALWMVRFAAPRRARIALALGAPLLLTASLSGHAADSGDFSWAVLADWLHLAAAALWTGGLFFLAVTLRNRFRGSEARSSTLRFSSLAAISLAVLLLTGAYQFWQRVGSLSALIHTNYGVLLSAKLALAALLIGIGAANRFGLLPKLSKDLSVATAPPEEHALDKLFRNVSLEAALAIVIVAVVAWLVQLPPAKNQWAANQGSYSGTAEHTSHGAHPATLAPAEGASVKILSPKEGQVFSGDQVPIRLSLVEGKRGAHVHVYVDGELMGMFATSRGRLTGIQPGSHVLEARVAAEDHVTELDARDTVHFRTEK